MCIRSFNIDADSDVSAIEKAEARHVLATEKSIDGVHLFSMDRTRGVWNQMRTDEA